MLAEIGLALCIGVLVACLYDLRYHRDDKPRGPAFHKPPKDI